MPKTPSGSSSRGLESNKATSNNDTIDKPYWDTSPNTKPAFVADLIRWLPKQDSRFRTLFESNAVLSRNVLCFQSPNHIDRYA